MPYLVRENLFIGSIGDAAEILKNGSSEISHILSVLSSASISFFTEWRGDAIINTKEMKTVYVKDEALGSEISLPSENLLYLLEYAGKDLKTTRMACPISDIESENLLDYLDVCLDYIHSNRKDNGVLVHCFAGVSRSASIITAYLMRTEQLSLEDALASLRESCGFVCPNDGFLAQLKLFEEMGFKVDPSSPIYKRFRLKALGERHKRGEIIESSKLRSDPGEWAIGNDSLRCKKCRRVVALKGHVVDHRAGEGQTAVGRLKHRSTTITSRFTNKLGQEGHLCSSIFVEPLSWMTPVKDGAREGKLSCVRCEARLGYFNWSGIHCSCGGCISPAFQLHRSRVDVCSL